MGLDTVPGKIYGLVIPLTKLAKPFETPSCHISATQAVLDRAGPYALRS
jgi:hypothetical protein